MFNMIVASTIFCGIDMAISEIGLLKNLKPCMGKLFAALLNEKERKKLEIVLLLVGRILYGID